MTTAEQKQLDKIMDGCASQFRPAARFGIGLMLASIYHRNGKAVFTQNALALGLADEQIAAMLVSLAKPSNVPLRAGYTMEPGA